MYRNNSIKNQIDDSDVIVLNANYEESKANQDQIMMKSKSIRKLDSFKKSKVEPKSPYKSINISVAGVSVFIPDSSTFKNSNTKVMCIFIGHTRLESGQKDQASGNLLLDEESDLTFGEIVNKNKTLVQGLGSEDYSNEDMWTENSDENKLYEDGHSYQKYELTVFDINTVFLNNLAPFFKDTPIDDQDVCDDNRILQKFDIRLVANKSLLDTPKDDKMYKNLVYLNSGSIDLTIPNKKIPSLVSFCHKFMVNQIKTKDTFDKFKTQTKEVIEMLRSDSITSSFTKIGNDILQNPTDDDFEDDIDQAYYDALDEETKDVYNMIKTTIQNQDANAQENNINENKMQDTIQFKNKAFLICNFKALNIDINDRMNIDVSIDKSKDQIDDSDSILTTMIRSIDFAVSQTAD